LVADEYQYAVKEVINNELPKQLRIRYLHFDMKIRKKEPGFPASLVEYAKQFVRKTGMFYCGRQRLSDEVSQINIQRGIIRTNCIDSLDRTNEG